MKRGVQETSDAISNARQQISSLKDELAKAPKGPAGKEARQKIAAKAKAILADIKRLK